ncbi:MAG: hypothetical protein IKX59_00515 [Bacteroidales bacterium]|nr:hypothetical protein [Bacteroidales bacterium]MBR5715046.1 hypothetical protein [Bacteroidales bacterium]
MKKHIILLFVLCLVLAGCDTQTLKRCPDENHPHMIDLGLPSGTKWACCNVGASMPEEFGGYYAWGETEENDEYSFRNNNTGKYVYIGDDISGTLYDVAHVQWGGSWRMPTQSQIEELMKYCTIKRATKNKLPGRLVIGSNKGSIFLPAAGEKQGRIFSFANYGKFWSSTFAHDSIGDEAYNFAFYYSVYNCSKSSRLIRRSVRPVCP